MEVEAIHELWDASLSARAHRVHISYWLDDDRSGISCAAGTTGNNLCASSRRIGSTRGRRGAAGRVAVTYAGCTRAAASDDVDGGI